MNEIQNQEKSNSQSLEDLLKKNIELNQEILNICQKTDKRIFNMKVFGVIKFLLVFLPVLIGIFYLIPVVSDFIDFYQQILGVDFSEAVNNLEKLRP